MSVLGVDAVSAPTPNQDTIKEATIAKILTALVLLAGNSNLSTDADHQSALAAFRNLGFEASHIAGGNIAISGDQKLFEKTFSVKLKLGGNAQVSVVGSDHEAQLLPTDGLPIPLKDLVKGIEFEKGLDFGPGKY